MQAREDDFDGWYVFFRMQADRNAAAIILDTDAAIGIECDHDVLAVAAKRFVGSVVDDFLEDVQGVFGPGIHARTLFDRLQPFQDTDGGLAVIGRGGFSGGHFAVSLSQSRPRRQPGMPRITLCTSTAQIAHLTRSPGMKVSTASAACVTLRCAASIRPRMPNGYITTMPPISDD